VTANQIYGFQVAKTTDASEKVPIETGSSAVPLDISPKPINAVPVRHPGRWFAVGALCVASLVATQSVATNPNFHWQTVATYVFDPLVLSGVCWTLAITVISMAVAIALAICLALMRESENALIRSLSWLWVWFFRGTPVYTQLVFWGLVSVLYSRISIGMPFGPELASFRTKDVITPGVAAIIGLAFNESAYLAEIFRAGLKSIDSGQREAAASIGMRHMQTLYRIVLPQAMRMIVPPTGNETIGMLKTTSLVLAVPLTLDLNFVTNSIANRLYLPIPLLIVSALWYLTITSVLMIGQHYLERHFGKGVDRPEMPHV